MLGPSQLLSLSLSIYLSIYLSIPRLPLADDAAARRRELACMRATQGYSLTPIGLQSACIGRWHLLRHTRAVA
eukprot:scaffold43139_cov41-Phaeocystis_antarctica.AAC.3